MSLSTFFGNYAGNALNNMLWVPGADRTTNGTHSTYDYRFDGLGGNDSISGCGGPTNWPSFNRTGDPLYPMTVLNWLTGGEGNDLLFSSFRLPGLTVEQAAIYSRADTLEGGDGDDRYFLRDNNVTILEGDGEFSGRDTILLSDAYFSLTGTTSFVLQSFANVENVILLGTTGRDITGSQTANVIRGGVGAETVNGYDGNDTLAGGDGSDELYGNNDKDVVYAGFGNDVLYGGLDDDMLWAGADNDTVSGDEGNDILYGGDGHDSLDGGYDNDGLYAGGGNDVLLGGTGDDSLRGEAGNDTLDGGDGNDMLSGQLGDDALYGGGDSDVLSVDSLNDTADGGDGFDTVTTWSITLDIARYQNVEALELIGAANRNILGSSSSVSLILTGNTGRNQIYGGSAADEIFGGSGNDLLYGGLGDDTLTGGDGADQLAGGDDSDSYLVDSLGDVVTEGSGADSGIDTVISATISLDTALYANVEALELTGSADLNLTAASATCDVFLAGNDGQNVVTGSDQADFLDGGYGQDTLYGGLGDDLILGANGDDSLYGGDGADLFVFLPFEDAGEDVIHDFTVGTDVIDLSGSAITQIYGGQLTGNTHLGSGTANAYGYFDTTSWVIALDYDGDGITDHSIRLYGSTNGLSDADFIVPGDDPDGQAFAIPGFDS